MEQSPKNRVTPITCPTCGVTRDAVTPMGTDVETPTPGHAVLVCTSCAAVCLLQEDWTLRLLTDEERDVLFERDPLLRVTVTVLAMEIESQRGSM